MVNTFLNGKDIVNSTGKTNQARFKCNFLAASVAAICMYGAPVFALEADEYEEEVVVVAKFKRSLEDAILQKKNADTAIEAIGLEDIGVLPAASIADALTALPGVAGARTDDGNISQLSIRGTTELALTTLNGREQVSISGDRTVEFALYPPNVMQQVQVHKSSKASLPEGGLTGVVNMQTIRPLDFDERSFVFNGQILNYELGGDVVNADDFGNRLSFNYTDQFSDTFGLSIAVASSKEVLIRDGRVTPFVWGPFQNGNEGGGVDPFSGEERPLTDDLDGDGERGDEELPRGFVIDQRGGERTLNSFFTALQFSPSSDLDVNFDFLYSERKEDTTNANVVFGGLVNTPSGDRFSNVTFEEDGSLSAATISGFSPVPFGFGDGTNAANQIINQDEDLLSTGINFNFNVGEWDLSADVSYSKATRDTDAFRIETSLSPRIVRDADGNIIDDGSFDLTYSALGEPTLSTNVDLVNPENWAADRFISGNGGNEDDMLSLQFDGVLEFDGEDGSILSPSRLKIGARYSDREKVLLARSNFQSSETLAEDSSPLASDDVLFVGTPAGGPAWAIFNPNELLNERFGEITPNDDINATNSLLLSSGSIEEENTSAYAELSFSGDWGVPVTGNIGVRYVNTESRSPGFELQGGTSAPAVPIVEGNRYDEFLPSFNLQFALTDAHYIRASWGTVIARAPINELRSTRSVQNLRTSNPTGSGGNPFLEPTKADQTTLSFEWYPDEETTFSISAHYTDFDTFVGTGFIRELVMAPATLDGFGNELPAVEVEVPIQVESNGDGGYIRGFEVAVVKTLFENFGISANYSYTETNIDAVSDGSGDEFGLTGLSKDVANASVWWADYGVEARIAADYRSDYVDPSLFGDFENTDDTLLLSANLAYDITPDFRVNIFGNNLTNETRRKFTGNNPDRTGFNVDFGRTYGVGVFYKF